MTLIVHHLQNSRSQRVLWLLEELGIPYDVKRSNHRRDRKTMLAPPELNLSICGKPPIIEDNGTIIVETGAIIDYLVENAGGGGEGSLPGPQAARRYRFFLHYAEGSLRAVAGRHAGYPGDGGCWLHWLVQTRPTPTSTSNYSLRPKASRVAIWFAGDPAPRLPTL